MTDVLQVASRIAVLYLGGSPPRSSARTSTSNSWSSSLPPAVAAGMAPARRTGASVTGSDRPDTGAASTVAEENGGSAGLAAIASTAPVEGGIADYVRTYQQRIRGGDMGSAAGGRRPDRARHPFLCRAADVPQPLQRRQHADRGCRADPDRNGSGLCAAPRRDRPVRGYAAGVCAFVMVRLDGRYNYNWFITMGAAVLTGVVIGFLIGWLRAKIRIPSVCRDAGFLPGFSRVSRC